MGLKVHGFSIAGHNKQENQDSISWSDQVFALADGMGGKPNGRKAAQLATELAVSLGKQSIANGVVDISEIVTTIHERIAKQIPGAGTTLAMVLIQDELVQLAHVGDSRIYINRHGSWEQIGTDQNLASQTGLSINTKILTNFLGMDDFQPPDVTSTPIAECDYVLICTDGMFNEIDVLNLTPDAESSLGENVEQMAHACETADDCSAIVVEFLTAIR